MSLRGPSPWLHAVSNVFYLLLWNVTLKDTGVPMNCKERTNSGDYKTWTADCGETTVGAMAWTNPKPEHGPHAGRHAAISVWLRQRTFAASKPYRLVHFWHQSS
jgi:hypothetical protein